MRAPPQAAVAGHAEAVRLQLFVDAKTHGSVGDGNAWLDLPPLAVLAQAPL